MRVAETSFRSDERFTQPEFRRWVEARPGSDINRYELINGRIVMTPPAGWTHSSVALNIAYSLKEHVSAHALGRVFESSVGYDLPSGETVEPDVSFVSAERFAAAPPKRPEEFLRAVPNLVVEVLSPGTAKRDLTEKKDIYERNRVDEYWTVDSKEKSVSVFYLVRGRTVRRGMVPSRALPRLRLPVERIFAL